VAQAILAFHAQLVGEGQLLMKRAKMVVKQPSERVLATKGAVSPPTAKRAER
jgi:hypothetical protein